MPSTARIAEALAAFRRGELDRARALAKAQLDAENGPAEADHLLGLIECREGRPERGLATSRPRSTHSPKTPPFE